MWWVDLHAAALQAMAGCFTALVGVLTLIFLWRAWHAADHQARAADRQASAAEAATAAAAEAAAAAREQSALLRLAQLEAMVPMLFVVYDSIPGQPTSFFIENQGAGIAFDIVVTSEGAGRAFETATNVLGPNKRSKLLLGHAPGRILIRYRSVDQRRFETVADALAANSKQIWREI
jgi:hypothetical protein